MNTTFGIVIFDRYPVFGLGIKSVLEKESNLFILKIIQNNRELFAQMKKGLPHLLVVNAVHSADGCIPILKNIKIVHPSAVVFVIINRESSLYIEELVNTKVEGLIFGDSQVEEVISAINTVLCGNNYFPEEVNRQTVMQGEIKLRNLRNKTGTLVPKLSPRENEVLKHFAKGLTYKEIGNLLFISPRTVETHKNSIMAKLHLETRAEIIKYAFLNRMI